MKNILLIIFVFISCRSFAQKAADNFLLGEIKYSAADSVVSDENNNTIHLYGKADFKDSKVNFQANEIVIYKDTKKVVATGLIAVLYVPAIKRSERSTNNILRYTMGENMVLVE